jgi:hypothetical protein
MTQPATTYPHSLHNLSSLLLIIKHVGLGAYKLSGLSPLEMDGICEFCNEIEAMSPVDSSNKLPRFYRNRVTPFLRSRTPSYAYMPSDTEAQFVIK